MPSFEPDPQTEPSSQSGQTIDDSTSDAKWVPTPEALDELLASFSPDREEAGKRYVLAREKLIHYFERRSVVDADRYADEALDRTMRRINEGTKIDNLMPYLLTVASYVTLEIKKEEGKSRQSMRTMKTSISPPVIDPPEESPWWTCFDECLDRLPENKRTMIVEYYEEEAHAKIELHKKMAERLGIPLNALRIRVHRIRAEVEVCVRNCLAKVSVSNETGPAR